jgi:hypothetical protein
MINYKGKNRDMNEKTFNFQIIKYFIMKNIKFENSLKIIYLFNLELIRSMENKNPNILIFFKNSFLNGEKIALKK